MKAFVVCHAIRILALSPIFAVFDINAGIHEEWRAQRDSNPQSSPSEGDALSSSAMGTAPYII